MKKVFGRSFLVILLFLSSVYSFPNIHKERLLIDCDIGLGQNRNHYSEKPSDIDDGFAILQALKSQKIKVLGITTVFGNTSISGAGKALKMLLSHSGHSKIPWVSGAIKPSSIKNPCPKGALSAAYLLSKYLKEPTNIMALGPLTNIGCLVVKYPKAVKNIKKLLVVMGRSEGTLFKIQGKKIRDFNFETDKNSVRRVLEAQIPIFYFPFELTRSTLIPREKVINISSQGSIGKFIASSSIKFLNFWENKFGENGFHPWDSAPISYLMNKDLFICEQRKVIIKGHYHQILMAQKSTLTNLNGHFCYKFSNELSKNIFKNDAINIINMEHKL